MRIITAIEMRDDDLPDFEAARLFLQKILNRHLSAEWTFKDKEYPEITWEGVQFLRQEFKP